MRSKLVRIPLRLEVEEQRGADFESCMESAASFLHPARHQVRP